MVELAARIADVPLATVNIITATEQHQVATVGFDAAVCRREDAMCAVTLREGVPVAVSDASRDPRFARNPFVTGELGNVRFYVAHPLVTKAGVPFGTLCVFDDQPRELDAGQLAGLATLAERIVDVFELRLRTRELSFSVMEIQAVQAELERSNERLALFASQVSHDLKTPLTTLSLSLSLIREQLDEDGELGPESVGLLDRAIKGSTRMADLIDDVLDYASLGGTLKVTEVDLDFVIGEVLEDLSSELDGVTMEIGTLPTVLGDRAQVRAVLQNMLSNAAKFRDETRAPVVAGRRPAGAAGLAHRDHRQRDRRTRRRTGSGSSSRWPAATSRSRGRASAWPPAAGSSAPTAAGSASTRPSPTARGSGSSCRRVGRLAAASFARLTDVA